MTVRRTDRQTIGQPDSQKDSLTVRRTEGQSEGKDGQKVRQTEGRHSRVEFVYISGNL